MFTSSHVTFSEDKDVTARPLPHALARSREGRHLTELMPLRQSVCDRWSFRILMCAINLYTHRGMSIMDSIDLSNVGKKTVPVRQYRRFRFGEWEDVCHHHRSPPR